MKIDSRGDVVGIVDNTGSLVVEYKYDAWGKPVITQTLSDSYEALAELNPFRYRGYVWDDECAMYYLKERYYDVIKARFINSDTLIVPSNITYGYCCNSPVYSKDINGKTTYALGTTYCVGFVLRVTYTSQVVFDEQGNVGFARTGTLGLGTPAASMGGAFTITNAETIYDLEGLSGQMGGSISTVGLDVFGSDLGSIDGVVGCTIAFSPVSSSMFAAEGHIEAALTDIVPIHESDYVERAYEDFVSFVKRTVENGQFDMQRTYLLINASYRMARANDLKIIEILLE